LGSADLQIRAWLHILQQLLPASKASCCGYTTKQTAGAESGLNLCTTVLLVCCRVMSRQPCSHNSEDQRPSASLNAGVRTAFEWSEVRAAFQLRALVMHCLEVFNFSESIQPDVFGWLHEVIPGGCTKVSQTPSLDTPLHQLATAAAAAAANSWHPTVLDRLQAGFAHRLQQLTVAARADMTLHMMLIRVCVDTRSTIRACQEISSFTRAGSLTSHSACARFRALIT
jgi:hypothetical protein